VSEPSLQDVAEESRSAWWVLVKSFAALASGELGARVFSLVAVLALARRLGPDGFGLIALGTALLAWVALASDSGTELLNVREVSRRQSDFRKIVDSVLGLRLALSLVAMVVLSASAFVVSKEPSDRETLVLFSLALPAMALNLRWMVVGVGGSRAVGAGNIASQIVYAGLVLALIHVPHDTLRVPVIQAFAEFVYATVVLVVVARRFGLPRPRVDLPAWSKTMRAGFPLMINGLARASIYSLDILLIAVIAGRGQVGIYSAASRPVLLGLNLIGLYAVSFLSTYSGATPAQAPLLFRHALRAATAVTIPVALVLSVGATIILPLLFGHRYAAGVSAMAVLAWRIPLSGIAAPYGYALIARDRQSVLMHNNLVVALANVFIATAAILAFGVVGAAIAAVASQFVQLVLNYRSAVQRRFAPGFSALRRGAMGASEREESAVSP
jgi:O-antigen/teichoic acid export membrane protein